jgi:hypothetical protein
MAEEISVETLKKLLEKASEAETKYLLFLETNTRPGESFTDITDYEVLTGEIEIVELEHSYNYPYENYRKYLAIPKTIPVVIRWWHRWDFGTEQGYTEIIYIFTKDGWKQVQVFA